MERQLDYLESLEPSKQKLKDLELLTRIIESTDKTARRTFGLDQPHNDVSLYLGIVPQKVSQCDSRVQQCDTLRCIEIVAEPLPVESQGGMPVASATGLAHGTCTAL